MEDNEEFCYKGYSHNTLKRISEREGSNSENVENSCISGYATDYTANEHEQHKGYGDFIVEEFSVENRADKVKKFTKLSDTRVDYIMSVIYVIFGVLCVSLTSYIGDYFSYIVGAFMGGIGIYQFVVAIYEKEYVHTNSNQTAMSLLMMVLSVVIIIEHDSANVVIAIAWGLIGLLEGAHAFNHAFSRIARGQRSVYYIVKGMIEVVLALLLLHDPEGHLQLHITVFGIQLIFDAITSFPPFKRRFSKK